MPPAVGIRQPTVVVGKLSVLREGLAVAAKLPLAEEIGGDHRRAAVEDRLDGRDRPARLLVHLALIRLSLIRLALIRLALVASAGAGWRFEEAVLSVGMQPDDHAAVPIGWPQHDRRDPLAMRAIEDQSDTQAGRAVTHVVFILRRRLEDDLVRPRRPPAQHDVEAAAEDCSGLLERRGVARLQQRADRAGRVFGRSGRGGRRPTR